MGPYSAVLLLRFLLKIRSVRILDTVICYETLLWLFSPAWDAVILTLQVGFIRPFVVIDPTDLGATIVVGQTLCLTIFNLSPTQKPAFLPMVIKLVWGAREGGGGAPVNFHNGIQCLYEPMRYFCH